MNIAIIKQSGGKYLFEVPDSITLKEGEKVKCDTRRGVTDGIVWADSITVDEPAAKLIGKLLGANFPLKSVVGKTVTSVEMFEQPAQPKQEHVKLYCVKESNVSWVRGALTKGKIYEFDGHFIEYDSGTSARFNDFESWKRGDPNYAACLVPLVSRPAKVGEWVYIKKKIGDYTYNVGDIGKVEKTYPQNGNIKAFGGLYVLATEYLVLDGYKPKPEKAEPEYYSGKVVCVDNGGHHDFWTVGRVYEFKNGFIEKCDNGSFFSSQYKTLEEANNGTPCVGAKFIEFKGE